MEDLLQQSTFFGLLKDSYFIYNDKNMIGKVKKQIIMETHNDDECIDEDCMICIRKFKYEMKPQIDYISKFKTVLGQLYTSHDMIITELSVQYFDEVDFFPIVVKFEANGDEEHTEYRIVFYQNYNHDEKYLMFSKNNVDSRLDMLMVEDLSDEDKVKLVELKIKLSKLNIVNYRPY